MPSYRAISPDVLRLVNQLNPAAAGSLHELSEGARKFIATYRVGTRIATAATQAQQDGSLLEAVQVGIAALQISHGRRLAECLAGVIGHVNNARLLDLAFSCRAVIEYAGAIVFYEERLRRLLVPDNKGEDALARLVETLDKATRGGRFDWSRWFKGRPEVAELVKEYAKKHGPQAPLQVKNVMDFIDALDRSVASAEPPAGTVTAVYALLSDICHPAVGGWLLYARPDNDGWLNFGIEPAPAVTAWFVGSIVAPTVNRSMRHAAASLNNLTELSRSIRLELPN